MAQLFQNHLVLMVVYAACVGIVGGVLLKDTVRDQARAAGAIFASLVGAAVVAGWLLYFLPV